MTIRTHGIGAETRVGWVIERWPEVARVFRRHRMACVGCAMAPHMTLAEAGRAYHLAVDRLVAELRGAALVGEERS